VNETLLQGETRTLEANDAFRFKRIGNAPGLKLTLNGTVVPPLGDDGHHVVKDKIFDREALQQLRGGASTAGGTAPPPQTHP
jgi:hypothetical protein